MPPLKESDTYRESPAIKFPITEPIVNKRPKMNLHLVIKVILQPWFSKILSARPFEPEPIITKLIWKYPLIFEPMTYNNSLISLPSFTDSISEYYQ